ncbi:MAG: DUF3467 domain-containing protein [Phycisphaerales bacterium]|jgi:hypothetical protein|nr:DUF3467 domain-containing protein [Phycisphaerales bacterium]
MADQPQQQQVQLQINDAQMTTTYANTIRTSTTMDEVVLDFGINMPTPTQDNRPTLRFDVNNRVVMNWKGAKRLAISLGQVIRQFEQANGEIPLDQPRPAQAPEGGPRLSN